MHVQYFNISLQIRRKKIFQRLTDPTNLILSSCWRIAFQFFMILSPAQGGLMESKKQNKNKTQLTRIYSV